MAKLKDMGLWDCGIVGLWDRCSNTIINCIMMIMMIRMIRIIPEDGGTRNPTREFGPDSRLQTVKYSRVGWKWKDGYDSTNITNQDIGHRT